MIINKNFKDEKIYLSWAILENFVFEEDVKEVLCGNCIRNPAWNLDVKVLLSGSLRENLLELVGQVFVLRLEVVNDPVFVFNVSLQLSDLMLKTADLIFMDVLQLLDFSLSCPFHAFSLRLDQGIVLNLLCLPSVQALLDLSSQISFSLFQVSNLIVADSDFTLL